MENNKRHQAEPGGSGEENDEEIQGEGNTYNYGFRIYNSRLGRFLSLDPLFKSYAWNSPYSFAENDVIRAIDLDGLEKYIVTYTVDADNNILRRTVQFVKRTDRVKGKEDFNVAYRLERQFSNGTTHLEAKGQWRFKNQNSGFDPNSPEDISIVRQGTTVNGKGVRRWLREKPTNFTNERKNGGRNRNDIGNVFQTNPKISFDIDYEHNKPTPVNPTATETTLSNIADILKSNTGMKIEIIGHTSSETTDYKNENNPDGFKKGNMALSYDRAKYAYDKLIEFGVSADQLSFTGKGSTEPLQGVSGTDPSQKRTEVKLTEDKLTW